MTKYIFVTGGVVSGLGKGSPDSAKASRQLRSAVCSRHAA
ncbi:unknown [Firmicutes bacterium CAG:103]|nr:unknown [Firmicutes bacterium CAG:103]